MDYRTKESEDETRGRISLLASKWNPTASKVADLQVVPMEEGLGEAPAPAPTEPNFPTISYKSSWFVQFYLLYWRSFNEIRRDKVNIIIKVHTQTINHNPKPHLMITSSCSSAQAFSFR